MTEQRDIIDDLYLLPSQFAPGWPRSEHHDMIGALLVDAIKVLTGRKAAPLWQWKADLEWLDNASQESMSFNWCCRLLDINGGALRRLIHKHLAKPSKRPAKRRKDKCPTSPKKLELRLSPTPAK